MTKNTGEKLSDNQDIDDNHKTSASTGVVADHFKAEADPANSRYVMRVELANKTDPETLQSYLKGIDDFLKGINIEYKAKRDSQRLRPPVLHVMREGWYERQRKEQVAKGKRAFQAKTELLSAVKLATVEVRAELDDVIEMPE